MIPAQQRFRLRFSPQESTDFSPTLPRTPRTTTVVSQRRSMLDYLKRKDEQRYKALIAKLGLRR